MFLELINDLLMNSSMFYIYFGVFFGAVGFIQLHFMQRNTLGPRKSMFSESMCMSMLSSSAEFMNGTNESFIIWFGKSCKRMYRTDDDLEDDHSSYFIRIRKIRGGQLWEKTTYAPRFVTKGSRSSVLYV